MTKPFLSLIIPARNEEARLPSTLEQVVGFLNTQTFSAEVLVVENGSQDRTLEIAQDFSRRYPFVRVLQSEQPGKGLAVRYNEPHYRHVVGRIYNWMIRTITLPGLQDTQCGFKCFRGEIVEELFACQTLGGWAFDVEILFIARRRGYRIQEVPIPWYYNAHSKISVLRDSFRMGLDLLTIRLNGWRGLYDRR